MIRRAVSALLLFVLSWLAGAASFDSDNSPLRETGTPPPRLSEIFTSGSRVAVEVYYYGADGYISSIGILYEDRVYQDFAPVGVVSTPPLPTALFPPTNTPRPTATLTPPPATPLPNTTPPPPAATYTPPGDQPPTMPPEPTPTQESVVWTPAPTLSFPKACIARVTVTALNVRDNPSVSGHILGQLYAGAGTRVEAFIFSEGAITDWLQIRFAAGTGYIARKFTTLEGACQ